MISKVNNSPSFGMAFKQDKVLSALQPMKEKTLQTYANAAGKIDALSEQKGVDVFLKGVEEAVGGAAYADDASVDTITKGFKLTISGRGEDPVNTVFEFDKMPETTKRVKRFFDGMEGRIRQIGILEEIKNKFGI